MFPPGVSAYMFYTNHTRLKILRFIIIKGNAVLLAALIIEKKITKFELLVFSLLCLLYPKMFLELSTLIIIILQFKKSIYLNICSEIAKHCRKVTGVKQFIMKFSTLRFITTQKASTELFSQQECCDFLQRIWLDRKTSWSVTSTKGEHFCFFSEGIHATHCAWL